MAIFADVIDEWKKASGKEKLLIAGGGAAVVALALYLHSKSSSQPTGTGTTGVGGSFQPSTGSPGGAPGTTSSPPPNDGGLPPPGFLGPPSPVPSNRFITVGKDVPLGTTLQQIATQFGLSMQQLAALNPWAHIGQAGGYDTTLAGNIDNLQVNVGPQAPAASAPSRVQPNTTMQVYAQTRHAPAVVPTVSKQRAG